MEAEAVTQRELELVFRAVLDTANSEASEKRQCVVFCRTLLEEIEWPLEEIEEVKEATPEPYWWSAAGAV